MNKSSFIALGLLSACLSMSGFAQNLDGSCTTLEDALNSSIERSPVVRAAEADVEQARADLSDARAQRRPQVSAFARTQAGDEGLTGSGIENTLGLQASQRLYDFGLSRLDRESAKSRVRARSYSILSAKNQAALQTGEAFLAYLEVQMRLQITQEREVYFQQQYDATEQALQVGGATRADLAEIGARLADANADRLELLFERDRISTELKSDTGELITPCDTINLSMSDVTIVDQIEKALASNSELLSLGEEVQSLEADAARSRLNRLPAIDLVAIASYAYDDRIGDWEYRDRIGIDVSVPLLSGNALNADRRRQSARLSQRRSERQRFRLELQEAVEVSSRRLLSLRAQVFRRQDVVSNQEAQFEAAQIEFEAGLRTLPELVDDRLELEIAKLAVVDLEFEIAREQLNLQSLTGGLASRSSPLKEG